MNIRFSIVATLLASVVFPPSNTLASGPIVLQGGSAQSVLRIQSILPTKRAGFIGVLGRTTAFREPYRPVPGVQEFGRGRTIFSDPSIRKRMTQGIALGLLLALPGLIVGITSESKLCESDPYCGFTDTFIISSLGFTIGSAVGSYPAGKGQPGGSLPAMLAASVVTFTAAWGVAELSNGILGPLILFGPALAAVIVSDATVRYPDENGKALHFDTQRLQPALADFGQGNRTVRIRLARIKL